MPECASQQELNNVPALMRVYSENETNNFNSKTGHRLYDDYKNRNTNSASGVHQNNKGATLNDINSLLGFGVRHSSVNETLDRSKAVKDSLWNEISNRKENTLKTKLYNKIPANNSLTPDKKVLYGEDDEKVLDLYFNENLDSILYDNECLIPLEAFPKNKSNPNLKRKRNFVADSADNETDKEKIPMMYDEYIPDLDFINNFQRMQEYYEVNPTFESEDEGYDASKVEQFQLGSRSDSSLLNEVMEHSHVQPMQIKSDEALEVKMYNAEELTTNDSFIDVTKLPLEFENLPYSQRKKILVELCPNRDIQEILYEMKRPDNQLKRKKTRGNTLNSSESLRLSRSNKSATTVSTVDSILKRFDSSTGAENNKAKARSLKAMGYNLNKIIGQGAWGVIRECINCSDPADVKAMKIVKYRDNLSVKLSVINEVSIWKNLRHKNVLSLVDYMQGENAMFCLMNQIHGGTLYDYVVKKWYNNEEKYPLEKRMTLIVNYSNQIVDALEYLHKDAGVVHGDLKLENCLMTKSGTVLLCDFGMSRKLTKDDYSKQKSKQKPIFKKYHSFTNLASSTKISLKKDDYHAIVLKKMIQDKSMTHDDIPLGITSFDTNIGPAHQSTVLKLQEDKSEPGQLPLNQIGSLPYAAPELLDIKNKTSPMTDIWAFGVLMYTMCVYELPFQHEFEPRLKMMIESAKYDFKKLSHLVMKVNPSLCFVIEGCLTKNVDQRWNTEKIKRNLETK